MRTRLIHVSNGMLTIGGRHSDALAVQVYFPELHPWPTDFRFRAVTALRVCFRPLQFGIAVLGFGFGFRYITIKEKPDA